MLMLNFHQRFLGIKKVSITFEGKREKFRKWEIRFISESTANHIKMLMLLSWVYEGELSGEEFVAPVFLQQKLQTTTIKWKDNGLELKTFQFFVVLEVDDGGSRSLPVHNLLSSRKVDSNLFRLIHLKQNGGNVRIISTSLTGTNENFSSRRQLRSRRHSLCWKERCKTLIKTFPFHGNIFLVFQTFLVSRAEYFNVLWRRRKASIRERTLRE